MAAECWQRRRNVAGASAKEVDDKCDTRNNSFFQHWTYATLLPITTRATAGLLTALVHRHLGSVVKGFALDEGVEVVKGYRMYICCSSDRFVMKQLYKFVSVAIMQQYQFYVMYDMDMTSQSQHFDKDLSLEAAPSKSTSDLALPSIQIIPSLCNRCRLCFGDLWLSR
eukprot:scaffold27983_cov78-Skeletonema_dohrnii-CCMP3373.AAC.1